MARSKVEEFCSLLQLSEGDRAKTRAAARDMARIGNISEMRALSLLWQAGVEGFIRSRLEPALCDQLEAGLKGNPEGDAFMAYVDRIFDKETGS